MNLFKVSMAAKERENDAILCMKRSDTKDNSVSERKLNTSSKCIHNKVGQVECDMVAESGEKIILL